MSSKELELRLTIEPAQIPKLRRLPILSPSSSDAGAAGGTRSKSVSQRLRSIYFDTPDGALEAADISLRVRGVGRRMIQTAKMGAHVNSGFSERIEDEAPITGDRPVLDAFADPQIRSVIGKPEIWERLSPVFETDFRRTERRIQFTAPDGKCSEILADLDQGEIRADGRTEALAELELELADGSSRTLFDVALRVHETVPVRLGFLSKAARGQRLSAPVEPKPVKAKPVKLESGMRLGEAAAEILGSCITQIAGNEPVILLSELSEGPHQMRVGIRRLRAALSMFNALVPEDDIAEVAAEARWLAGALGAAREWDVFLEDMLAPVARGLPDQGALSRLAELAMKRRDAGRAGAREAVASARFTRFLLLAGRLREDLRSAGTGDHLVRLGDFAASALEKRFARTRKIGRRMLKENVEARHELRLRLKKMRYLSEFHMGLYDRKRAKPFAKLAARLQDMLGYLNDYEEARRQVGLLAQDAPARLRPEVLEAGGVLIGWHGRAMVDADPDLMAAWQAFSKARRFWPKPANG